MPDTTQTHQNPKVLIGIPVWNKSPETVGFFVSAVKSIKEHVKISYHLAVYDNASPAHEDPEQKNRFLEALSDISQLTLLTSAVNVGFGPAVNALAKIAEGDKIPFFSQMNSDCELVEDSFQILIDVMTRDPRAPLSVAFPEHYENCQHYNLDKSDELMGNDWRFGAFWVARTRAFTSMQGFDPVFSMCYWEDTDLWRRMEERHHKLRGYRGTWVKHKGGASSLPNRDEHFNKNAKIYQERWGAKVNA